MALSATPPKSTLRSKLHLRPSTSLKVSRVAVFTLLALISVQTVSSALLWYAGKIKADSSSRVVTTGAADSVTTTGATLHGTYDYPTDVTQRGFQYGLTTSYGSQVVDGTSPADYMNTGQLNISGGASKGLAVDASGNIYRTYFPDENSASVRKYDPQGTLLNTFGELGSGNGQFSQPMDIALDSSGNMYVADMVNNRVQKLDSSGNFVSQILPLEQNSGIVITPSTVAVDSSGNVYIGGSWNAGSWIFPDRRPAVQKYSSSGVLQVQIIDSTGQGANQLYTWIGAQWSDMTVDANGNLYVTDTYNYRVLKFDSSGVFSAQLGTTGVAGSGADKFDSPYGISADSSGRIYVVDNGNDRVQIFDAGGTYIQSWSGNMFSSEIAVSLSGRIYLHVSNIDRLNVGTPSIDAAVTGLQCDTTYHYRAFATDADSTEYGADGTFTTEPCRYLRNITTLPVDNISQTGATLHGATDYPQGITGRGFQFGLDTNYGGGSGIVADNSAVSLSRVSSSQGLGGPAPQNTVNANDIVIDSSGAMYVADSGNSRIRKYSSAGAWIANWPVAATGLAIDANNIIFATTASSVQKLDTNGNLLLEWGVAGSGNSEFNSAAGLDVSVDGFVYVADYGNSRIQKFNSAGDFITKWGTYGQGDYEFGYPEDVAVDRNGNVYVGDYYDSPIPQSFVKKYDAVGVFITEWGGNVSIADGKFTQIRGLVANAATESVYVADRSSDPYGRIQQFGYDGTLMDVVASGDYFNGVAITAGGEVVAVTHGNSNIYTYSVSIDSTISGLTCGTTYHYRSYVTDRSGWQFGDDATFTTSACPPLNITTTALDDGVVGVSYSDLITVDNLQGGETYSVSSGSLPPGLNINSSTGFITGTPSQAGTFNFDVTVENAGSSDIGSLSITIAEFANPLNITTVVVSDAQIGASYQDYINTSDSVSDVSFSIASGALPDGMSITSYGTSGVVYGTPTTLGTYTFTVQAQDSRGAGAGTDSQEYSITVAPTSIQITTATVPPGRVGASYDFTIDYTNANATPVFSVVSGSLPPGVSLTLQGYLQGTPTQEGTYNFTVQADDGFSTDTQALSITVLPALTNTDNSPLVTITSPSNNSAFPGGSSTITGTGPANQTISIFIDGTQVGTTTATTQGTWTYQVSGVAVGSHNLEAKWVPGAEIMFVPVIDTVGLKTIIKVYDTSNDTLVKDIALPQYSYGYNVTVGTKGILVAGVDMSNGFAKVWLINLNSADVVAIPSDDSINASVFSQDGNTLYSMGTRGTYNRTNMTTFETQTIGLWLNESHYSTMHLSEDESKVYVGTTQPAIGPLNPTSVPSEQRVRLGVLYEINALTGSLEGTINTVDNSDLAELEYATGLAVAGNTAYVPVVRRAATADPGTTAESYIKLYNLSTGQFIRQITVSTLSASGTVLAQGGYADLANNILYFHGRSISDGAVESIVRLNLLNDDVVITPLNASESTNSPSSWGIDSGGQGTKLYTPRNVVSGGVIQAYMEVMDVASGNLLDTPGYPINVGGVASYAIQLGSSFSAIITPPKDSIAFTVAEVTTDDCKLTNTCPVDCVTTNTCPPTPCEATGTCPVVQPPLVQPPTPTTVGTTGTKYPKIVTTPFPPATPSVSRLGWFDRGVLAVARFVPRQAAIGFPYLLFILLLLFALSLYYQSTNEVRKDKLNRQFLAKRKSIRAQQDNFIALASHYLNTPITIIQNGIEVMEEQGKRPKGK